MIEQKNSEHDFLLQVKKEMENTLHLARTLGSSGKTSYPAIRRGNIILYSYSNPAQETAPKNSLRSHFSPFILFIRLKHAHKKDIIYFTSEGHIVYPAIEIRIPDICTALRLTRALSPLTPDHFPGLTTAWRLAIKSFSFLLNLHRVIIGEKILATFCAQDHAFFGSVYVNHRGCFVSFHCHSMDAPTQALNMFQSLLASQNKKI